MGSARRLVINWARRHARLVHNTCRVVVSILLLLVAYMSFSRVVVQDLTKDLLHASRSALGRQMGHGPLDSRKPWHDPAWVTRVRQSGNPPRAGGFSVLVTGAAGFVGSFTSLAIAKKGWGVVGLDNFNHYYDPALKLTREKLMHKNGRIFVVHGDINDADLIRALFHIVPFTHVLHLAAQAGVRYAKEDPMSYVQSNVAGLVSVLEVCARARPQPAFVWASSSSVYGLNSHYPFSEIDRTDQPASLYAATKKAGEEIVHVYNYLYGLSVTTLRFFTVYGPLGRPDMAIYNFTESILSQTPIQVYRGPNNTAVARDFTYIGDIVNGIMAAVETAAKSTGYKDHGKTKRKARPAQFRIFNLGGNRPVTVDEMVTMLEKTLNRTAIRLYESMDGTGDVPYTAANLTLAEKHLGYSPRTSLKKGLKKFVLWYLKYTSRNRTPKNSSPAGEPSDPSPAAGPQLGLI
ncbi:UDP-glucuronate 4-epimerase [Marchantia polymorpha subsp. ruderalis]|uniref:NAD(P)-binding domain-containing protein n=2 Tax=Marchantia polymorpha TaxID=3197 RepID=A0AAF6BXI4_MARPO|nr:hypothetical protein MARPO_0068s0025 [Marchantia polymorpha]BBN16718.1 hypothetical protein Mp_7g08710 [Marchantia polymorpha subsp. ruderalis]|eukprot:PTQ35801.1 hypothetical protein MARPO_0068s0025 [Marchantia polymorpha]